MKTYIITSTGVVAIATALAVSACGSSASRPASPPPSPSATMPNAADLAGKIGCIQTTDVPYGQRQLFATQEIDCVVDSSGTSVMVLSFASTTAQSNWAKAAEQMGAAEGVDFRQGHGYVVTGDPAAVGPAFQATGMP